MKKVGNIPPVTVRLDLYSAPNFNRGAPVFKEVLWIAIGSRMIRSWVPGSSWRVKILRLFGARIGNGTIWKPGVRVKFPWRLEIGDHCWIGEDVWIDNLAEVRLSSHTCVSQGAYLCTGNHNWSVPSFDLVTRDIEVKAGAWIGARAIVTPGSRLEAGAILTAGSVASGQLQASAVYSGVPAQRVRTRLMASERSADDALSSR